MEFLGCGDNQVKHIQGFMIQNTKFKGEESGGTALEIINTTGKIVNCTFISNSGSHRACVYYFVPFCTKESFIGGAIIITNNSTVYINQSKFEDNRSNFGGAIYTEDSIINMTGSVFVHNNNVTEFTYYSEYLGAVLYSKSSTITIVTSDFRDNVAYPSGGVLYSKNSVVTIKASQFSDNSAQYGAVLYSQSSIIKIEMSEFQSNSAALGGGVLYSERSIITIVASEFRDNNANGSGGVLSSSIGSTVMIKMSEFDHNTASDYGGVMYSSSNTIILSGSRFTRNLSPVGAVIYAMESSTIQVQPNTYLLIDNNFATRYAIIHLSGSEFSSHEAKYITFFNNSGSLMAFNGNITLTGYAIFVNNQPSQTTLGDFQEGGAITLFQSKVFFDGTSNFEGNHAENGGAVHSIDSKLYVNGNVTIAHNTANRNGGGVYLSTSELNCQQRSIFVLFNNTAARKGGGLHAISSSIKAASLLKYDDQHIDRRYYGTRMNITENAAGKGGGLSLEANSKLYILKYSSIHSYDAYHDTNTTIFTANSAVYGGAVYVDDDTNSGMCASDPKMGCFLQVLAIYKLLSSSWHLNTQSVYFARNYASLSGSILYGGLLDRCAISQFAEVYQKYSNDYGDRDNAIAYFMNVSNPKISYTNDVLAKREEIYTSVSSSPVRVCLCINNHHDGGCTHNNYTLEVKKGEAFTISVIAVDQIGHPVKATIYPSLNYAESSLAEGELARKIPAECTYLTFNVFSPHNYESLTLYASDGPCKDVELSRAKIEIQFLPCSCPIGLQVSGKSSTNCTCECHSDIRQYVEQCDSHTGLLIKVAQSKTWISYISNTDLMGYLVYPNCPFDYCLLASPPVNANPHARCTGTLQ